MCVCVSVCMCVHVGECPHKLVCFKAKTDMDSVQSVQFMGANGVTQAV